MNELINQKGIYRTAACHKRLVNKRAKRKQKNPGKAKKFGMSVTKYSDVKLGVRSMSKIDCKWPNLFIYFRLAAGFLSPGVNRHLTNG